ncbi:phospholipase D-like domain-containing protein [Yunchengibacter salinarum]|uniref:phospholipase D-like domain-containing protein n=1 Tax=Yunchengibacter salinarum TaxID=3133399 RepID=UPI0035B65D4B
MELIAALWQHYFILAALLFGAMLVVSGHVLATRSDARAAFAWLGVIWLAPAVGLALYFLFGMNRIRRRARRVRARRGRPARQAWLVDPDGPLLEDLMPDSLPRWRAHSRLAGRISREPPVAGNRVLPLEGGSEAYDAMITAIDSARHSVALTTYIFQNDRVGGRFVAALKAAVERGVAVRVLVDAVGNLYGFKPVIGALRRAGVPVARFNPARVSWRLAFFNLRTHRKMMVVDGHIGFAGGMNIRDGHLAEGHRAAQVRDTHFRISGPVVAHMMDTFADDWAFATREELTGAAWFPEDAPRRPTRRDMVARALADGPDEPVQKTSPILESALASARKRVHIVTPYFLPEGPLVSSLSQAALRGVRVDIIMPRRNNLVFFNLAAFAAVRPLLQSGCRIWLSDPPFDHSKLMVVDGTWSLLGSSNWDARSLKLNFEFNLEVYSRALARLLVQRIKIRFEGASRLTLRDLDRRSRFKRAAGRLLWLFSPYL